MKAKRVEMRANVQPPGASKSEWVNQFDADKGFDLELAHGGVLVVKGADAAWYPGADIRRVVMAPDAEPAKGKGKT